MNTTTMKKLIPLLMTILCLQVNSQVGIGTLTPDTSAMLDISSTTQGMLAPRMTSAQRSAISTPATGLLVYDTDINIFMFYDGSAWEQLESTQSERDNYVLVKSAADFPAAAAGVITLDENTLYEVNGTIVLNDAIDLNGAVVRGFDTGEDILFRAGGGTLFSGSKGGNLKNITLTAPGGIVFNIDDTAGDQKFVIQSAVIANSASVGTLKGFNILFKNVVQYAGNAAGVTYEDVDYLLLSNLGWFANNTGTYQTITGTFTLIEMVSGFSHVTGSNVGLDVSSDPTVAEGVIFGHTFTGGATTFVNKYTTQANPEFNFDNSWDVNCHGIPAESDATATGYYYMVDNTTDTTFSGTGTPTKILGTTTSDNLFRCGDDGGTNNRLVYTGSKTRNFQVMVTGTVNHITGGGRRFIFYLYKNGVQVTAMSAERRFSANDRGNFTLVGSLALDPNDYVEIWVEAVNNSNATEVERLSVLMR